MLLSCQNIAKSFGTDVVLKNISFNLNEKEKAAIIGINGSGKSTLLKIIVGESSADSGEIIFPKNAEMGYLAQNPNIDPTRTIYEEMADAKKEIIKLEEQIKALELRISSASMEEHDALLKSYDNYTNKYRQLNGYAYKSEITGVLKGLGFDEEDYNRSISTLSGGQRARLALAKLLLKAPDLLILDEPTNHLDMSATAWLEGFIASYPKAVLIVAHDRYFLDKTVSKVINIENAVSTVFTGNYSAFAEKRAMQREALIKAYMNQQAQIKHQEEVIDKLRSFNREKSIKRAESRVKALDKIERLDKPMEFDQKMHFNLSPSEVSGNDVLNVKSIKKAFGDNLLFEDISFEIKRGEKVALIGDNGTGKTTMLKIICDILEADEGEIELGSKVEVGYFDQEHNVLNPDKTVFDEISDHYPEMTNTKIRNVLAAFLFTNDDVFKYIRDLSGGEQARVSLALLMLSKANFLLLDEPTNHLDIDSKEILEKAIRDYTGTVLYVSHDRYFINATATRILNLTHSCIYGYEGNYDYYLENIDRPVLSMSSGVKQAETPILSVQSTSDSKLSYEEQKKKKAEEQKRRREIEKCEKRISAIETELAELEESLSKEEIYTDTRKLMEISNKKEALEEEMLELMEKWEELSE